MKQLWEILVPCVRNNGRPIRTRCHRVWDATVREITGGLTIMPPTRGQWISQDGKLFTERMIPVRIAATEAEMEQISDMTAAFYEQLAVMYYRVAEVVRIKHYAR